MTQNGEKKNTPNQEKGSQNKGDQSKAGQSADQSAAQSSAQANSTKGAAGASVKVKHSSSTKTAPIVDLKANSKTSNAADANTDNKDSGNKAGADKKPSSSASAKSQAHMKHPVYPNVEAKKAALAEKEKANLAKSDAKSNATEAKKATPVKAAPAKAEPSKPAKPKKVSQNTAPKKSGSGGKLAAGLIGGLVAVGGWVGINQTGLLPTSSPVPQVDSAASAKVESIEKALNAKIANLEAGLKETVNKASSQNSDTLNAKITEIETTIGQMNEKLQALGSGNGQADSELDVSVAKMNEQLTALSKDVGELSQREPFDGASLNTQLTELKNNLAKAEAENQVLVSRLDALEKTLQDEGPEQKAAKVLAASALQSQIASGKAYGEALKSYKEITGDDSSFAELEENAASGIATLSQLQQQFDGTSDAILSALEPKPEENDIFGQLLSNAKSLVKVKPVEGLEGSSPLAILGHIKTNLKNGELDKVQAEWQKLPEAGQEVGKDWIKAIEMRQTANGILDKVLHKMMAK
jgi:hypothetical protein